MDAAQGPLRTSRPDGTPAGPSIHQLRLFLALSAELHFGRTAARLFITQSALSRQIRDLERRLGVRLLERTNRAVALSAAGRALLPEIRAAVDAADRLRLAAQAQLRHAGAELIVGMTGAQASQPHTAAVLRALRRHCPGITTKITALDFAHQGTALIEGSVDVAFLRPPTADGIEVHLLAAEPRVACLPARDPLAARPAVPLDLLAGRPVVATPPQAPRAWRRFWAVDPRPDGSPVRYGPVASDIETLLHAVAEGEGVAFLPASVRELYPRAGVRFVDVPGLPPTHSALAWSARHRDRPTVAAARLAATFVGPTDPPPP
ncbi:LysR family transcriptional regulator [Kitasatospora sp. NPDC058201]|uniref:LysR family transcriptional regulator n=1 Tax=unclassified Kitasatospora TaxID=2633591 RepID=UPI003669F12F